MKLRNIEVPEHNTQGGFVPPAGMGLRIVFDTRSQAFEVWKDAELGYRYEINNLPVDNLDWWVDYIAKKYPEFGIGPK